MQSIKKVIEKRKANFAIERGVGQDHKRCPQKTKAELKEKMKKIHHVLERLDDVTVKYDYPVDEIFTRMYALTLDGLEAGLKELQRGR